MHQKVYNVKYKSDLLNNIRTFKNYFNLIIVYRDNNCLSDERCLDGICKTVCNSDMKCRGGEICENRLCELGCRSDIVCPKNQACINKQCRGKCCSVFKVLK